MRSIKLGLAAWHYPWRGLTENIEFFSAGGFNAFSASGVHFAGALSSDASAGELADTIARTGVVFTVHYKIPNRDDAEETEEFDRNIAAMREWQEKYGVLRILSFDVWGDRKTCIPKMSETVKLFSGSGTTTAFEDIPLNDEEAAWFSDFPKDGEFGILADLGHMNLRVSREGVNSPDAFDRAYSALPFKVCELHIHNNDGEKDLHDMLWRGTLDYRAAVNTIIKNTPDCVFTIESVPVWHGFDGAAADAEIFKCREYWLELWSANG